MADLPSDYSGMDTSDIDFPASAATNGLVESGWLDFGVISQAGDVDWFKVCLTAAVTYRFQIEAGSINGLFDPQLSIYSASNENLASATTGQGFQSKYLDLTPTTTGDYYLAASGDGGMIGSYKLSVLSGTTATTSTQNVIPGTAGNDILASTADNDSIDGGSGIDSAVFSSNRASHVLTQTTSGWTTTCSAEGTDTLSNVERLQFADQKIAIDLLPTQNGGLALEFIGLMAPTLIDTPSIVGLILGIFDQGLSLLEVCQLAIDVDLVESIAGSDSNTALAAMAFRNVTGVEADPGSIDTLTGFMDGRFANYTQAEFMAAVAGLEINQAHIGLVGLQQTGIEYI